MCPYCRRKERKKVVMLTGDQGYGLMSCLGPTSQQPTGKRYTLSWTFEQDGLDPWRTPDRGRACTPAPAHTCSCLAQLCRDRARTRSRSTTATTSETYGRVTCRAVAHRCGERPIQREDRESTEFIQRKKNCNDKYYNVLEERKEKPDWQYKKN